MTTTEIIKAMTTIMLAGFSVRLVPYNTNDAIIRIMHSEINDPMMTFDK